MPKLSLNLRGSATPENNPVSPAHDLRFKALLGRKPWQALPAAVQNRFSRHLRKGESRIYRGYVMETRYSAFGYVLAQILRLVGAPLPLGHTDNMAAVVTVTEDAIGAGQFWTRQYVRAKGFPQIIQSTKRFAGPTGLEEYIGYGIGMSLRISAENEALYFKSDRYFLQIGKWRAYLPKWAAPGQLTVIHADHGDGWFEFVLKLNHRLFGQLLTQRAMFSNQEDAK